MSDLEARILRAPADSSSFPLNPTACLLAGRSGFLADVRKYPLTRAFLSRQWFVMPTPPLDPSTKGPPPRLIFSMKHEQAAAVAKRARRRSCSRGEVVREALDAFFGLGIDQEVSTNP